MTLELTQETNHTGAGKDRAMALNCTPNKHLLLTGAGFSYAFGGLLAREFWDGLFRRSQVQARPKVRSLLQTEPSFELALAKARADSSFDADDVSALESAVSEVFTSMDRDIAAIDVWRDLPANVYGFQEFLRGFQCKTQGGSSDAGFIFTLNQDLAVERHWYNFDHWSYPPCLPGVPVSMRMNQEGRSWFSTHVGQLDDSLLVALQPVSEIQLRRQTNYLKLHGSITWRTADGANAMVIGTEKTQQIEQLPLISDYFEVFEEVLLTQDRKLMIAGYSFQDEHINHILARAVREANLTIHIWDPFVQDLLTRIQSRPDCAGIIDGVRGTWSRKLHEVFPYSQAKTSEWAEMREKFFGG